MLWKFCPLCNSSGPEIDYCNICKGDRDWPYNKEKRLRWWIQWKVLNYFWQYDVDDKRISTMGYGRYVSLQSGVSDKLTKKEMDEGWFFCCGLDYLMVNRNDGNSVDCACENETYNKII